MKLIKAGAAGIALLFLAACNEPQLIKENLRVLVPPESLYVCDNISTPKNASVVTEGDVARLLVSLKRTNVKCYNSLTAIRSWAKRAKALAGQ